MNIILLVSIVLVIALGVGYFLYRRRQRKSETRIVAFVGLLREPMTMDLAILAKVAGKAWSADLGDGASEGADGFVVGIGAMNTIMCRNRMYLINSIDRPYMDDPEKAAESIPDIRVRDLLSEHKAWFSCDALGCDKDTSDEEVAEWYRNLAKLFVELLDENCTLIYLTEKGGLYPINEETHEALLADDPVGALFATQTVPVIQIADDDPQMIAAVAKAQENWADFVHAFENQIGSNRCVKAPLSHAGNTEFIWVEVTALEGDKVYGKLGNDPANLGRLKLGSKVSVPLQDVKDWCYVDSNGNLKGGFTIEVVTKAAQRKKKS